METLKAFDEMVVILCNDYRKVSLVLQVLNNITE